MRSPNAARFTKKTTPASGGRLLFALLPFALPSYRPHFRARCGRPHGSVVLLFRIKNRSATLVRCGPLPPGASSIDLKDSEQFVQLDHDTSSDVGAGPLLLRSAEHPCSTPAHGECVKRPLW